MKRALLLIILIGITFVGIFLRLRNIEKDLNFFGDSDRDVLVAKHIVLNRHFTDARPLASGGGSFLENSPHYFNFLAVLYFFGRSPEGTVTLLALLFCAGIPLSYIAGKSLGGERLGLAFAFVAATYYPLLEASNLIYQPSIVVSLSVFFTSLLFIGYARRSILALTAAAFVIPLCLHFHYSVLPLLVPSFFLFLIFPFSYRRESKKKVALSLVPIAVFLLMILFWLLTINNGLSLDKGLWNFLTKYIPQSGSHSFAVTTLSNRIDTFIYVVFRTTSPLAKLFAFVIVSGLFAISYVCRKKDLFNNTALLFLVLLISIIFSFLSKDIFESYYSAYYFLFICAATYTIWFFSKKVSWIFFVLGIGVISTFWLIPVYKTFWLPWPSHIPSDRESVSSIVELILDDVKMNEPNVKVEEVMIIDKSMKDMYLGWVQPAYYFSLEELTGKKLVEINTSFRGWQHNNIRPLYSPKIIYLTCTEEPHEARDETEIKQECLKALHILEEDPFVGDYYNFTGSLSYLNELQSMPIIERKTYILKFAVAQKATTD